MTHTPGPWSIHPHHGYRSYDGRGYGIGEKLPERIVPSTHVDRKVGFATDPKVDLSEYAQQVCTLGSTYMHRTKEEIEANARLIAAAPTMLEALKETYKLLGAFGSHASYCSRPDSPDNGCGCGFSKCCDVIQAAIAAAEGGE